LAQDAGAPVAVMTTKGTDRISKNLPFRRTDVVLEIIEVIPKDVVAETPAKELCESTRRIIEEHLKK
jgi:hypothetical protein